ncbi:competence type IV pilus assembly protein ComGB [Bacillus sp. FSL W8-0116]|uniref:competence type IV pilus assembly protein ComGB n=1 Tax=Bacillus TaxID=1386 RepID=UPI0030F941C3
MMNWIAGFWKRKHRKRYEGDFIYRLGEMLNEGFNIGDSLEFLFMNLYKRDQSTLQMATSQLKNGAPLSQILQQLEFSSMVCLQVYFAERHGKLADTLLYAGNQLRKGNKTKEKMLKLLQYPAFLLFLLLIILFFLDQWILPRFKVLYSSIGFTASGSARFFMLFLQTAPSLIFFITIVGVTAVFLFLAYYSKQSPGRKGKLLLKLPFVRDYFTLYFTQIFSKEFSQLLSTGFAVNEILQIFHKQTVYPFFAYIANEINQELKQGSSFADVVKDLPFFDSHLAAMIRHGEKCGHLEQELKYFSHFCEQQLEKKIRKALAILQPAIFIIVGLSVISIYLSVMLPVFQMIESI